MDNNNTEKKTKHRLTETEKDSIRIKNAEKYSLREIS